MLDTPRCSFLSRPSFFRLERAIVQCFPLDIQKGMDRSRLPEAVQMVSSISFFPDVLRMSNAVVNLSSPPFRGPLAKSKSLLSTRHRVIEARCPPPCSGGADRLFPFFLRLIRRRAENTATYLFSFLGASRSPAEGGAPSGGQVSCSYPPRAEELASFVPPSPVKELSSAGGGGGRSFCP